MGDLGDSGNSGNSGENIMSTEKVTADRLAAAYIKVRDVYKQTKKEHEEKEAELLKKMETLQAEMNILCEEQNASSITTKHGTIIRSVTTRYTTNDWASMYDFINTHQAPYLLEKRVCSGAMKEFLEDHPDVFPIGMNTNRTYAVTVRRPTKKI